MKIYLSPRLFFINLMEANVIEEDKTSIEKKPRTRSAYEPFS